VVRDLFDSEREEPFRTDISSLFRAIHSSMQAWKVSYPRMKGKLHDQVWAWFKYTGKNSYVVETFHHGDHRQLVTRATNWLKKNGYRNMKRPVVYNARRNKAIQMVIQYKAQTSAKMLGHHSKTAINKYTKHISNSEILRLHREFTNSLAKIAKITGIYVI